MRVFTKEQYEELQSNKIYRMIMDAPPPDLCGLPVNTRKNAYALPCKYRPDLFWQKV